MTALHEHLGLIIALGLIGSVHAFLAALPLDRLLHDITLTVAIACFGLAILLCVAGVVRTHRGHFDWTDRVAQHHTDEDDQ